MRLRKDCFISCSVLFVTFMANIHLCASEKIRYTTDTYCDRHSMDAVYHEKFKLVTHNIFVDIKEFVSRVADLVADSLMTVMSQLPDKDVSDNMEKRVHSQFKGIKGAFTSKVTKMQKNITSSWENLITSHFDLMFDNGKSSLEDYRNQTMRMTDSYTESRRTLDSTMSTFVDFMKSTVRDGLNGIKVASQEALNKDEEEKKKNKDEKEEKKDEDEDEKKKDEEEEKKNKDEEGKKKDKGEELLADESAQTNKGDDEMLQDKMVEIAKSIVPGFLGNITIEVIQRKIDLQKPTNVKPESRDSVLDDIEFDMLMIRNRILAIIQTDVPRDKGATDLARRSIYTYWVELADELYKDKIRSKKSTNRSNTGGLYYRNFWKDEGKLVETLLNLMEIYP